MATDDMVRFYFHVAIWLDPGLRFQYRVPSAVLPVTLVPVRSGVGLHLGWVQPVSLPAAVQQTNVAANKHSPRKADKGRSGDAGLDVSVPAVLLYSSITTFASSYVSSLIEFAASQLTSFPVQISELLNSFEVVLTDGRIGRMCVVILTRRTAKRISPSSCIPIWLLIRMHNAISVIISGHFAPDRFAFNSSGDDALPSMRRPSSLPTSTNIAVAYGSFLKIPQNERFLQSVAYTGSEPPELIYSAEFRRRSEGTCYKILALSK